MKNVHAPVKDNKCEDCHLRHGLVTKLVLKKDGNELCFTCHAKDKLGLSKAHVHTAVKSGQCVALPQPARLQVRAPAHRRRRARSATSATTRPTTSSRSSTRCCRRAGAWPATRPRLGPAGPAREGREGALPRLPPGVGRSPSRRRTAATRWSRCRARRATIRTAPRRPKLLKSERARAGRAPSSARPATPATERGEAVRRDAEGRRAVRDVPRRRRHQGQGQGAAPAVQGRRVPALPQSARVGEPGAAPKRKGNALCVTCHTEKGGDRRLQARARGRATRGCLSCHVAHSSDTRASCSPRRAGPLCGTCHAKTKEAVAEGEDAARAGRSGRVHRLPRPARLERQGHPEDRMDRVCYACHTDAETKFAKTYTHKPVRDGDCASCHQPHGSDTPKLLKARGVEALRVVPRGPDEAARRRREARAVRRGHVPDVPRPAREQRQGHGRRQPRRRSAAACHAEVEGAGRQGEDQAPAGRRRRVHGVPQPAPDAAPRAAAGEGGGPVPHLPQDAQGAMGGGRRALTGREGLPALPQAAFVRREAAAGQPVSTLCASCHDVGHRGVRRRAPADRPGADAVRALPRRARLEGSEVLQGQRSTRRSPEVVPGLPPRAAGRRPSEGTTMRCASDDRLRLGGRCSWRCRPPARGQQNPYRLKEPNQQKLCLGLPHRLRAEAEEAVRPHGGADRRVLGLPRPARLVAREAALGRPGRRSARRCHDSVDPRQGEEHPQGGRRGRSARSATTRTPRTTRANLVAKGNDLCVSCHKDVGEAVKKAKFKHSPVAQGCVTCHAPARLRQGRAPAEDRRARALRELPQARRRRVRGAPHEVPGRQGVLHVVPRPARLRPAGAAARTRCTRRSPAAPAASATRRRTPPRPFATKRAGLRAVQGVPQRHGERRRWRSHACTGRWPTRQGCVNCHNPHASKHAEAGEGGPAALCGSCHADTVERIAALTVKHAPVDGRHVPGLPFAPRLERRVPRRPAVGQRALHDVPRLLAALGPPDRREGGRPEEQEPARRLPELPQGARHRVQAHAARGDERGAVHAVPQAVREVDAMKKALCRPPCSRPPSSSATCTLTAAEGARFRYLASVYVDEKDVGLNLPEGVACDANGAARRRRHRQRPPAPLHVPGRVG